MSCVLTPAQAEDVIDRLIEPLIILAASRGIIKRADFHLTVMDPVRPITAGHSFEDSILVEKSLGTKSAWEHPYDKIARQKAEASWRTGLPTSVLVLTRPYLLRSYNTKWWGSAVLDDLVVGGSGVEPWFDEAINYTTAAWLKASAIDVFKGVIEPAEVDFVGEALHFDQ